MSFLANDRYVAAGDRDRERSRGSRDRATLESDYGRLTDRPEGDWGYGGGRGRGRSPGMVFSFRSAFVWCSVWLVFLRLLS